MKWMSLEICVRNFTPAWFAAIMGTGVISILFHNFPYATGSATMKIFTFIFFFLNLAFFVLFSACTIARYVLYPQKWRIMIRQPAQSLYLGCFPMGATTLITIAVVQIEQEYGFGGRPFLYALWALWWVDVAVSFLCAFAVVHVMKTRQNHDLSCMTSVWLLPVVTLVVASTTGGILAAAMLNFNPMVALVTLSVAAFMVLVSLSLAFMILTIYLLRLIIHGLPEGGSITTVFIPLGPMGQGGYSILLLGSGFKAVLPLIYDNTETLGLASTGEIIHIVCLIIAFTLWSLGSMWMLYGLLAIQDVIPKRRFPFKLPFWGLIFPNGVYATLTVQLARALESRFFRVWGAIYSVATLLLWIWVFIRTLYGLKGGEIFEEPSTGDIEVGSEEEKRTANCNSIGGSTTHII